MPPAIRRDRAPAVQDAMVVDEEYLAGFEADADWFGGILFRYVIGETGGHFALFFAEVVAEEPGRVIDLAIGEERKLLDDLAILGVAHHGADADAGHHRQIFG